MKKISLPLLLVCLFHLSSSAQQAPPEEKRPPFVILQTGIGLQWFGNTYKFSSFSLEMPVGNYLHLGVQGNKFYRSTPDYYDSYSTMNGGFEVGGFAKYFLHGRLSGRKSGFYCGPELRFGRRDFQERTLGSFPPNPFLPDYLYYRENFSKLLVCWGLQWQFKHASLEIAAPFGMEFYKNEYPGASVTHESQFILMPTLQLGIAL